MLIEIVLLEINIKKSTRVSANQCFEGKYDDREKKYDMFLKFIYTANEVID